MLKSRHFNTVVAFDKDTVKVRVQAALDNGIDISTTFR